LGSALLLLLLGIGPNNAALANEPARFPERLSAASTSDVLINEFVAKEGTGGEGVEWVELYNTTTSAVDITGWLLETDEVYTLTGSIPLNGYLVITNTNVDVNNSGGAIRLLLGTVTIDEVTFGNQGGAPLSCDGYSTSRVPDAQDTDDDARDWNLDVSPTPGSANDAPGVSLGSSLVFNEFDNYPTSGNDLIEIYNPTASDVVIESWLLSDGDGVAIITGPITITVGGWQVIEENVDWVPGGSSGVDFTSTDVGYLFQPDGVRVDQIGWEGEYENDTFQRIPDGAGPNDGYDWSSSGGGVTWFDVPETFGSTNNRSLNISKDGPSAAQEGEPIFFTVTYGNMAGDTAQNVVITESLPAGVDYGGFVTYTTDLNLAGTAPPVWDAGAVPSHTAGLTFTVWVTFTGPFSDRQVVDNVIWIDSSTAGFNPVSSTLSTMVLTGTTFIHEVQGSGLSSPIAGEPVIIEGVVVGDFQNTDDQLGGFFVQEENADADADPLTSEGIFIYDDGFGVDVDVGDVVRVQGDVNEYRGLTRLTDLDSVVVISSGISISPTTVTLPLAAEDDYEPYEGMLVTFPQDLTVTEVYNLGRYGQVSLSQGGRLFNPTNVITPGVAANALQDANDLRLLVLDDGDASEDSDPIIYPSPGLSATNTLRTGYTVSGITGVLDYAYGDYRLQPTSMPTFVPANPRPATPEAVGGALSVASFNVLNYFTTIDTGAEICGPDGDQGCRGADSASEFTRQRDKIINAIATMDADVVGLMEIENNAITATQDLVDGLNAVVGAGTYAYVDTGTIGDDVIKVAFIYQPGTVTPVGSPAILDSSVDPLFNDELNRPALAQTFEQNGTGERFTAVVNHLKSKSCYDASGDDADQGDGQGCWSAARTDAATALANWLATDPTGSGDPDVLIIGDLNSYAKEDPITAIKDAGYADLLDTFIGAEAYSYIYAGQSGYLDHALSSSSLTPQVVSATVWHINTDEPLALDYNEEYKSPGHVTSLYKDDPYRASDHDPVIVGLDLGSGYHIYLPLVVRNN